MGLFERDAGVIADIERIRFFPLEVVGGEGSFLIAEDGRRLLDLSATWGAAGLGYGHPAVVEAVTAATRSMAGAGVLSMISEPAVALAPAFAPLVTLLEVLAERVGPRQFPETAAYGDASWVGYRLAELLPLPLSIKQGMLEINDAEVRLGLLQKFLRQQGLAVRPKIRRELRVPQEESEILDRRCPSVVSEQFRVG